MNKNEVLKNFAVSLLPLLIFIIADELYGTEVGLIVAVISGVLYLIYYLVRYKTLEKMILLDTLLILLLGGISIVLDNAIFFMLKPALIEFILVVITGIHAFSQKPLLLTMSRRYLGNTAFLPEQLQALKNMSRLLFVVILLHTLGIIYTALYASKEVWAFVSGGLFYIIFALILAGQWIYLKFGRKPVPVHPRDDEEMVPLMNSQGRVIGKATRSQVHANPELLHPVVHLHLFNAQGKLFLQKRGAAKKLFPGLWDTAVGGHVRNGESIAEALERESQEEIGVMPRKAELKLRYIWKTSSESELVHSFTMDWDGLLRLNEEELDDGRFWSIFEIQKFLGKNVFTPNFEHEFLLLQKVKIISRPIR